MRARPPSPDGPTLAAVHPEPPEPADQARLLRDLMGLFVLPALWAGRDADTIVRLMAEAVERMVDVAAIYVEVQAAPGKAPSGQLRVHGRSAGNGAREQWQPFIEACRRMSPQVDRFSFAHTPLGELQVLRLHLAAGGRGGTAWFAAPGKAFPSFDERTVLRAAASVTASGLYTARANYERERASRAKDEFLAMLGHELRNPLAPIVTALNLMRLKGESPPSRELQIIERQVAHLSGLVDDLLDVTRITRGKVELKREPVDVMTAVTEAIESVSPLLEARHHLLSVDATAPHARVLADPGRLRQILGNLLSNAAKYTEPNGRIKVCVREEAGRVSVEIEDNGRGIEPDVLPRIFELFEQGTVSLHRSEGGLGIGLALVKRLVDLHGGSVRAASAGPGKGSTFTVSLPTLAAPAPGKTGGAPAAGALAATPRRVLLVDDNADACETMRLLLEARGHVVASATNGPDALAIVGDFLPEVSLLDIGLPVMSGYELAGELRRLLGSRTGRLVAVTGYGQASDKARAREAGFDAHLVKPVDIDKLLALVEAPAGAG